MTVISMTKSVRMVMVLLGLTISASLQAQTDSFITPDQQATLNANEGPADTAGASEGREGEDSAAKDRDEAIAESRRMRSIPYCDIITMERGLGWTRGVNYSTFRVGTCDVKRIDALTAASAKAQMATLGVYDQVLVTGPYYFTMDVNATQVENPYISLGDLRFAEVSRSEFTLFDAIRRPDEALRWYNQETAYNPIRTTGDINFIWFAGTKIHVLTSHHGEVFVMTGVDHEIAFGQNGIRVQNLGSYLNLPEGWTFQSMRLKRVLSLNSHVLADTQFDRLIDEFGNLYIQLPIFIDITQKADPVQ